MRKYVIVLVLVLFGSSMTFAQFNFGVKAGYSSSLGLSNLNSVSTGDYTLNSLTSDFDNGFHFGVFARLGAGKIYFQPELLYTRAKQNSSISLLDVGSNLTSFNKTSTMSVIDVPLLLGYKAFDFKIVDFHVFAGPKLRFDAGSTLNFSDVVGGNVALQSQLLGDIKPMQVGFVGGVGVDLLKLTLDVRYNLIGNMYETKLNSFTIDKMAANNFEISLGWKLF